MAELIKISELDAGTPDSTAQIPFSSSEPKTYKATAPALLTAGMAGVNIPTPAADVTAYGLKATMTVDTNAEGFGAPLAMAADGNLDTADADSVNNMPCIALALETGTGSKKVLLHGVIRNDAWNWTLGAGAANLIYVSITVGTLTQTKPTGVDDVVQPVGWALSADVIYFCPSMMWITHTG